MRLFGISQFAGTADERAVRVPFPLTFSNCECWSRRPLPPKLMTVEKTHP